MAANLKKGKSFTSSKPTPAAGSRVDARQRCSPKLDAKRHEKKLRGGKELNRTARSRSANSVKDGRLGIGLPSPPTARTRSTSPTPSTPLANAEAPLRKFRAYASRMASQFEAVRLLVRRQPELAESLHELNRQRNRATEFAVRFSRNNLYQVRRLVNEIKQIIVPYPFDNLAKSDREPLCKKLLLAYQATTQALQTYINYMRGGQNLDVPEKIRELILLVMDLYLCCEHISFPCEQVDILAPGKELVMQLDVKIAEARGMTPSLRVSEKQRDASEKEDKRFSMYKTKLTNMNWKKKTEALARIKFGAPKLTNLRRMKKREESVPVPKMTFDIYSQRVKDGKSSKNGLDGGVRTGKPADPEKAAGAVKRTYFTPREVTSQDDDIETVVQSIEDEELAVPARAHTEPEDQPLAEHREDGPNHLHKSSVRELVLQTIQEIQSSDKCDVKSSLRKLLRSLNPHSGLREPPTQPRNVKLVHIISTEPIPEEPEEEEEEADPRDAKPKEPSDEPRTTSPTATERKLRNLFRSASADDTASDGRLRMRVSEDSVGTALRYKKALSEYRRNNVMYKRGIPVRPCELVLRVSDQIINDIIREISSGMEDENLLNQLYCNELLEVF